MLRYTRISETSRELRKKMTDAEKLLWSEEAKATFGYQFRQRIIGLYCGLLLPTARLVIEIDGESALLWERRRKAIRRGMVN
jgi:very-short-patch-repair endonuclease